ncbi:MAG: hypothetical protein M1274_12270 [Actinobacteria bacterium]|nr:hypothetical protein [Actinomycetota bacterium]
MILISRKEAGAIMTSDKQGSDFNPKPGEGIESGVIDRVWYEDDGLECWVIRPFAQPGKEVTSCGPMGRKRLIQLCARAKGVSEDEIKLWLDTQ